MNNLAIIPARGGSKRIPRKNIRPFCGLPIMQYSIQAAIDSKLFQEIMVSTEDGEIAETSRRCGANVPFLRSIKNADDYATIAEVIMEVLEWYQREGRYFDIVCCIFPTAPLIRATRILEAFDKLRKGGFDAVFPVLKFSYPIQRALKVEEKTDRISMVWPENLNVRSQDLPDRYHDCGQFYLAKTDAFMREKTFFSSNAGVIELTDREVQDIDNKSDWMMAEFKFKHAEGIEESNSQVRKK